MLRQRGITHHPYPRLALSPDGALSPVAGDQSFPHLLSSRVYMKEEKEEDCKGEF